MSKLLPHDGPPHESAETVDPGVSAWLSDAALQGLVADDAQGPRTLVHLVDAMIWAAFAAGLVWCLVEFFTGITR